MDPLHLSFPRLYAPKSHQLRPPSHLLRGSVSTQLVHCLQEIAVLGSCASCRLPTKRMSLQETICQRANSARHKDASIKGMCVAIVCDTSKLQNVERNVSTEHYDVLWCFATSLLHTSRIVFNSFSHIDPKYAFVHNQNSHRAKKEKKHIFLKICFFN